jgi:hypothetical protein
LRRSAARRRLALFLLAAWAASGTRTAQAAPAPADPAPEMQMKEVRTKDWLRQVQEIISVRYQVDISELRFSAPPPKLAAFVRGPAQPAGKKKPARPRRHDIVVVDVLAQKKGQYRALTARGSDEPPRDLRFLRDDRLVYEAPPAPPPPPPKHPTKHPTKPKKTRTAARARKPTEPPGPPPRLFVIQPIGRRARPIRCEGVGFTFPAHRDHLAFVGGAKDRAFVSVDGVQVYPRKKGRRTTIASEPVWSKDGTGLAFLETAKNKPARLVLLGAYDSPREDAGWDLPPGADLEGARVFWARPGKLLVGKAPTHPIFSASFDRPTAGAADTFDP